jgi:signal transduction histidine kinase
VRRLASALAHDAGLRIARAPPRPWALLAIAVGAIATPVYTAGLAISNDDISGVHIALLHWISVPYVLVGLIAWWRRPNSRLGGLMITAGFAMGLSTLQFADSDLLFTVGATFDLVPAALFLHVFLAFPDGRLRSRLEQVVVGAAYAIACGLQLAKLSLGMLERNSLIAIWPHSGAAEVVQQVQLISLSMALLVGAGVLAARRRHEGRPRRRSLALLVDSFALGLVMAAILFVVGAFDVFTPAFQPLQRATLAVIGLSPVAFLIGLLDARLARSAVGGLMIELRADLAPSDLHAALARALRDPTLTLAYWLPDFQSYVDLDGRPVEVPDRDGRATTVIDRAGAPVAALLHDPGLHDEPDLLNAVTAAAGIALDNARLHAQLRARLEELRGSRARVIDAGQKERQRLERNLHDGAQQRLVALSLELGMLGQRLTADPEAQGRLARARREITLSLDELRDVARGIHPAVLSGHGLEVALESIVARAPLPVRLLVRLEGRLQESLEVAAYYVVSESLANIGKHAKARSATVEVARKNGEIVVEVIDDGIGGADTERGTGLRGLADRVEALGGRLRVWTPSGGGTRVRAEIPCA